MDIAAPLLARSPGAEKQRQIDGVDLAVAVDDSVTFCVYTGSSAGAGDLDGTLRIAVCDDDAYDHNVCIEGDVNGTIDIDESGCEDPPVAGIACLACSS